MTTTSFTSYDEMFVRACGGRQPYPFQQELAEGGSLPHAIRVPTGSGKTILVVLGWLWRRRFHPDLAVRQATPRRLVYCLPMRTLVEQTATIAADLLRALNLLRPMPHSSAMDAKAARNTSDSIDVHTLMGGSLDDEWALYPERDAILVGVQDMLLSRALNRGYAQSRFQWPRAFGLLHSDVLWVFDEVQLMGSGVGTAAQLDGLASVMGTAAPRQSIFMSATLDPQWLHTVDHPAPKKILRLDVSTAASIPDALRRRLNAVKVVRKAGCELTTSKKSDVTATLRLLADEVAAAHVPGTQTLVILNTVHRASELYHLLLQHRPWGQSGRPDMLLLHARFRPADRARLFNRLLETPRAVPAVASQDSGRDLPQRLSLFDLATGLQEAGRIVIATQIVEAGVDISSRTLFTELAPWASVVQRLGRCNREGEYPEAHVFWITCGDDEGAARPYTPEELKTARDALLALECESLSPSFLDTVKIPMALPRYDVPRRRDVLALFDTTADLSGLDIDISRFVRDTDESDVRIFWREVPGPRPAPTTAEASRDELCPVPVGEAREFARDRTRQLWHWDALASAWHVIREQDIRPGMVLLANASDGGYDAETGWSAASARPVDVLAAPEMAMSSEGMDSNRESYGTWQTLGEHTAEVVRDARAIVGHLGGLGPELDRAIDDAAHFHDIGKSHACFQEMLLSAASDAERKNREAEIWAKAPRSIARNTRRHFRHEVASMLALLTQPELLAHHDELHASLVLYLVLSHHGKARVGLRSLPDEKAPPKGRLFTRGVWEGDRLPALRLDGVQLQPCTLALESMLLGSDDEQPTWLQRALRLRDGPDVGPFRLAYLEAILRAADVRASMRIMPSEPEGMEPSSPAEASDGDAPGAASETEQETEAESVFGDGDDEEREE